MIQHVSLDIRVCEPEGTQKLRPSLEDLSVQVENVGRAFEEAEVPIGL